MSNLGMRNCAACHGVIADSYFMRCSRCGDYYDLQCANISENRYRLMEKERKKVWTCPKCHDSLYDASNVTIRRKPGPSFGENCRISGVNSESGSRDTLVHEFQQLCRMMAAMNDRLLKVLEYSEACQDRMEYLGDKLITLEGRLSRLEPAIRHRGCLCSCQNTPNGNDRSDRSDLRTVFGSSPRLAPEASLNRIPSSPSMVSAASKPQQCKGVRTESQDSVSSEATTSPKTPAVSCPEVKRHVGLSSQRGNAGPDVTKLKAMEPRRLVHLWNMKSCADDVSSYLREICTTGSCTVTELKSRGDYKSYKLSVPEAFFDICMSPNTWPINSRIKEWTFFRGHRSNTKKAPTKT